MCFYCTYHTVTEFGAFFGSQLIFECFAVMLICFQERLEVSRDRFVL